ncbi:MAG: hypothetical protein M1840_006994 [Geoglossum simile]|nr:MAG: hypothetical protein M1840_006994 [Geoglossum simile]
MPEVGRENEAREKFLRMVKEETTKDLSNQFSAIDVLSLFTDGRVSAQARHRRLKECLMNASDQVRMSRVDARTLFSATHFAAFFKLACDHFARYSKEPFDFVKSSRLRNPVSPDLAEHLSNFLKSNIKSSRELMRFAVPMIASSFLLDNYPPDMHAFSPADVFQVLYRDICYQVSRSGVLAYENTTSMLLPSGFVMMIEGQLARWFENFIQGTSIPSAEIHHKNIQRFKPKLREIRNGNTCLVCLRRKPEYSLPCGHSLCENCVCVFGECSEQDAWVFEIRCYFLCGLELSEVTVKVKPPTAGVRVLCIDGGGARGIIPLQSLQLLQERLGIPCPIQENFEVAFGTSSGFLIVLAMFVNGWSAEDCANIFENLAKTAFQSRIVSQIPILSRIQELLITYLADSFYPADDLEAALKDVFGSDRGIMDCSHATATGTKVGMPATTILGTLSCIFTNYNGVGVRPQDCGMLLID